MTRHAPDFLGVGMERAGTSWLFAQIASHPEIWVPPLKELHFFDVIDPQARFLKHRYRYHLPSRLKQKFAPLMDMAHRPEFFKNTYLEYLLWDFYFFTGRFNSAWYQRLFDEHFTKGRVCGEFTPAYSNVSQDTMQMMLDLNPNIKFLMMVRNPKERLWSGIIHYFRHVEKRDFTHVSDTEILGYLEKNVATDRSDLLSILTQWNAKIDPDHIRLFDFSDIQNAPEDIIKLTYEFLGVDKNYRPPEALYKQKINSYTKKTFQPSDSIQTKINDFCNPMIEKLSVDYPDIIQKW